MLSREGFAAIRKWPDGRAMDRGQIGPPASMLVGLDMAGA
jgi:hypothetical protein